MRLEVQRGEVGTIREEVSAVEERLSIQINKVQETVEIIQNVVVKHFTNLEQRVITLEDELHPSKNQ